MKPEYYYARARAAHIAAEAAVDPRDKAAWRSAAQTWERLAKPAPDTYSLEPLRRDLEALKKDVALTANVSDTQDREMPWCDQCRGYHHSTAEHISRRFSVNKTPVAIEF